MVTSGDCDKLRRGAAGQQAAERTSWLQTRRSMLRSVGALLVAIALAVPGRAGQFDARTPKRSASAAITLIATLEALGVTVASTEKTARHQDAIQAGSVTYAVTTRSAVLANRTTIYVSCSVQGGPSLEVPEEEATRTSTSSIQRGDDDPALFHPVMLDLDPGHGLVSLFAEKTTRQPETRTDLLNIRMNNGVPPGRLPKGKPEQLNIVAQAL